MTDGESNIPRLHLVAGEQDEVTDFAVRTMEEIEARRTQHPAVPHRHTYYSVVYMRTGSGTHTVDFQQFEVSGPVVVFISPEQVHHFEFSSQPQGHVILFSPDFLNRHGITRNYLDGLGVFFACDVIPPLSIPESLLPELDLPVQQIHKIWLGEPDELSFEFLAAWLRLFLLSCKKAIPKSCPLNDPSQLNGGNRIVKQFKDLVEAHFRSLHKVSDYADMMHITPNYLNDVVKQETGRSAKIIILDRIMLEAERLATWSNLSAKEVAYSLGYTDPTHFNRVFKNQSGMSFRAKRLQIREKYL